MAQVKTEETDGYTAIQVASGWIHPKNQSKPVLGHLKKHGIPQAKRHLQEFRVTPDALIAPGTELTADHYLVGQLVDVCANSYVVPLLHVLSLLIHTGNRRGKGFQGPMKRWGFKGGSASHGNSKAHRSHGGMGGCQDPGKVWKGKKMAGHMGAKRTTVKNLLVYKVDSVHNLVYIKGAVPGPAQGWVRLTDAKNKKFTEAPPFPTYQRTPGEELKEKVLFVPKPTNVTWDVEDIELRTNVYKDLEQQKLADSRSTKNTARVKRRREEKKVRSTKKMELKSTKSSERDEVARKRQDRDATLSEARKNRSLEYEEDSDMIKE